MSSHNPIKSFVDGYFKCWISLSLVPQVVSLCCLISSRTCIMFDKVIFGHWPVIRIACLANMWRAVRFLSQRWVYLHVAILLTYRCTMLWSLRQVVYTSGSVAFLDKSYSSFLVSVVSMTTFDKFKLPYIINDKIEDLRTIFNQK
jgi:hypothetical protein